MGSGQQFAADYTKAITDYFRPLGLVDDDSFGLTQIKLCDTTLQAYMEVAWHAGRAKTTDTPHPAAGPKTLADHTDPAYCCQSCGKPEGECSANPCAAVVADRDAVADDITKDPTYLLTRAAETQTAYWDALRDLEATIGYDLGDVGDLKGASIEDLKLFRDPLGDDADDDEDCECGRPKSECATSEDEDADHGDLDDYRARQYVDTDDGARTAIGNTPGNEDKPGDTCSGCGGAKDAELPGPFCFDVDPITTGKVGR